MEELDYDKHIAALSRDQIDKLLRFALKTKVIQKECLKRYYRSDKSNNKLKMYGRKYYYKKNDIFHPELNKEGKIEKKHKRPVVKE